MREMQQFKSELKAYYQRNYSVRQQNAENFVIESYVNFPRFAATHCKLI